MPSLARPRRQMLGACLLAGSIADSVLNLLGRFHPLALRMRAHGGTERMIAVVVGSLSLQALVLITGALLTFWPESQASRQSQTPAPEAGRRP